MNESEYIPLPEGTKVEYADVYLLPDGNMFPFLSEHWGTKVTAERKAFRPIICYPPEIQAAWRAKCEEVGKLRDKLHEIDMDTEGGVDGALDRSALSSLCNRIQSIIHPPQ